jgi:ankyrin repeat protein
MTKIHDLIEGEEVEELFEYLKQPDIDVNEFNDDGHPPLISAIVSRNIKIIRMLLDKGADINIIDDSEMYTPLHLAVLEDNIEIIQMLLDKGANINILCYSLNNGKKYTPLHLVVLERNIDLVEILLEKGANINLQNSSGETPLHLAVLEQDINIVKMLLEKGAHINLQNSSGETPLHLAIKTNENDKIINLLIDKGADKTIKNKNGKTPFNLPDSNNTTQYIQNLENKNENIQLYKFYKPIIKFKNPKNADYKSQAIELWPKKGYIMPSEGFFQHIGECVNDAVQFTFAYNDCYKEIVQPILINSDIDKLDFSKLQKNPDYADTFREYLKSFQSRFIRHYLNESELQCSPKEEAAKEILYGKRRTVGANALKSFALAKNLDSNLSRLTYKKRNLWGLLNEPMFRLIESFGELLDINYLNYISEAELIAGRRVLNYDLLVGMLITIQEINIYTYTSIKKYHKMSFNLCGGNQIIYENYHGLFPFPWLTFIKLYNSFKGFYPGTEIFFSHLITEVGGKKYEIKYYPSFSFNALPLSENPSTLITFCPITGNLIELLLDEYYIYIGTKETNIGSAIYTITTLYKYSNEYTYYIEKTSNPHIKIPQTVEFPEGLQRTRAGEYDWMLKTNFDTEAFEKEILKLKVEMNSKSKVEINSNNNSYFKKFLPVKEVKNNSTNFKSPFLNTMPMKTRKHIARQILMESKIYPSHTLKKGRHYILKEGRKYTRKQRCAYYILTGILPKGVTEDICIRKTKGSGRFYKKSRKTKKFLGAKKDSLEDK